MVYCRLEYPERKCPLSKGTNGGLERYGGFWKPEETVRTSKLYRSVFEGARRKTYVSCLSVLSVVCRTSWALSFVVENGSPSQCLQHPRSTIILYHQIAVSSSCSLLSIVHLSENFQGWNADSFVCKLPSTAATNHPRSITRCLTAHTVPMRW